MQHIQSKLALVAIVLGSTLAFAFKAPAPAHKAFTNDIWEYTGGGDTNPANYTEEMAPPTCPSGSTNVCYILAPEDPAHPGEPLISAALSTRITNLDTRNHDVFVKQ